VLFRRTPFWPRVKARFVPSRGPGTITSNPFVNNTGTLLASLAVSVFVYEVATGAIVTTKSGSTNGSGIWAFTDALFVQSTAYRCVTVFTVSGAEGMDTYTAA
jgi:nitrous oxidase accessory protein NosD